MKKLHSCYNNSLGLDISKGMTSGKRMEKYINVKRYSQPDSILGKRPTQSIIILLKGSSNAVISCQ